MHSQHNVLWLLHTECVNIKGQRVSHALANQSNFPVKSWTLIGYFPALKSCGQEPLLSLSPLFH